MSWLLSVRSCHCHRYSSQNTISIVFGLEESIAQRNSINAPHVRILDEIWIDEEENRHVHRLARVQPLLLKTETLNLAKVWRHLRRCDRICRHSYDIGLGLVGRSVESERCLARKDADLSLLGSEFPGKNIRDAAIKGDSEATVVLDRAQAFGWVTA